MSGTIIILNAGAGTIRDRGAEAVRAMAKDVFAARGIVAEVVLAEGDAFLSAIDKAAKSGPQTIVVGGGDGSAGYAARHLAGSDRVLGLLPLGTLNLLAKALGMPVDLGEALDALATASVRRIDLASVNGRVFHTFAGLGFFAEMARARARVREDSAGLPFGRFLAVARSSIRAFTRTGMLDLDVNDGAEEQRLSTYALVISNNRLSGVGFERSALDEGILEAHFAEGPELLQRLQAGLDLMAGRWRENPDIRFMSGQRIAVASRRPRLWISIDGELVRIETPVRFEIMPGALQVLVPKALHPVVESGAIAGEKGFGA